MVESCFGTPWFGGFFWWTGWEPQDWTAFEKNGTMNEATASSYEPKAATVAAMKAALR